NFGVALYNAWAPQLDGDFNFDGVVDAADFTVWRDTEGATGPGLVADANADDVVVTWDSAGWRGNYGATLAGGAWAVPEPTGFAMRTASAAAVFGGWRGRSRQGSPRGITERATAARAS